MSTKFHDRKEAGLLLAERLKVYNRNTFGSEEEEEEAKKESFIVMAIPRGGVILGDIIASELNIAMDIIICKKIGAQNNPELAIGAVMPDGSYFISQEIVNMLNILQEYIQIQAHEQVKEIDRRLMSYRGSKEYDNEFEDK